MRSHLAGVAVKTQALLLYPRNKDLMQSERRTSRVSFPALFGRRRSRESMLPGVRKVAIYAERGEDDCRITMPAARKQA